ncbi:MAG: hypothetical protein QOF74_8476 [Caballeronia mineralivorans]|jgi:hypothetical protein|nr:hypothetical protein [Caballeronia mineralivorans]
MCWLPWSGSCARAVGLPRGHSASPAVPAIDFPLSGPRHPRAKPGRQSSGRTSRASALLGRDQYLNASACSLANSAQVLGWRPVNSKKLS